VPSPRSDLRQEHWSTILRFAKKNLQKVSVTFGLIRGCTLGLLEASALGSKMPAPDGKVICFVYPAKIPRQL